jgi:hypothetical protein
MLCGVDEVIRMMRMGVGNTGVMSEWAFKLLSSAVPPELASGGERLLASDSEGQREQSSNEREEL